MVNNFKIVFDKNTEGLAGEVYSNRYMIIGHSLYHPYPFDAEYHLKVDDTDELRDNNLSDIIDMIIFSSGVEEDALRALQKEGVDDQEFLDWFHKFESLDQNDKGNERYVMRLRPIAKYLELPLSRNK